RLAKTLDLRLGRAEDDLTGTLVVPPDDLDRVALLAYAVVLGPDAQLDRRSHLGGQRLIEEDSLPTRREGAALSEADLRRKRSSRLGVVAELVRGGGYASRNRVRLTRVGDRPHHVLVRHLRRNADREDPALTTGAEATVVDGREVGRLDAVELGGLDVVVLADGDVDDLPRVAVHEAEGEREATVGIRVPPIEEGGDDVTTRLQRPQLLLERIRFLCRERNRAQAQKAQYEACNGQTACHSSSSKSKCRAAMGNQLPLFEWKPPAHPLRWPSFRRPSPRSSTLISHRSVAAPRTVTRG